MRALVFLAACQLCAEDYKRASDLELAISGLALEFVNIDMQLADADFVLGSLRSTLSITDYHVAMLMLTVAQSANCKKLAEERKTALERDSL